MEPIRQEFTVSYSYEVSFTENLFHPDNPLLKGQIVKHDVRRPIRVLFVIDDAVARLHPSLLSRIRRYFAAFEELRLAADPFVVPGGETVKIDPGYVQEVHRAIYDHGICRHSFVIAIGGGAVLDMVGYAAATAHRGVHHIRIPTTVLSQNDSGVGVKNGVNSFGSKNFSGSFMPPDAVINDFEFLTTLEDRDWRSGIAEAVKVALIKEAGFFSYIQHNAAILAPPARDMEAMKELVYRCARLHVAHISTYGDPFERGSSRPLDFGHWAAHKLESLTNYRLRHGEAVAIGIALDCTYAHLTGLLSEQNLESILDVLEILGFSLYAEEMELYLDDPSHPQSLFRGLDEFREHLGGRLTIMLLKDIGEATEIHEVDLSVYRQAIAILSHRKKTISSATVER